VTISVVQTATGTSNPPASFASGVTAGNTVFLVATYYDTNGTQPAPSASSVKLGGSVVSGTVALFNAGTTNGVNSAADGSNNVACIGFWMLPNCPGGSTAVDITTGANNIGQVAYEVAGLGSSPVRDVSTSNTAITAGAVDSGTTSGITNAPEFIIGGAMVFGGAGAGAPSGWTYVNPSGDQWIGYQIATSSGGTYNWHQAAGGSEPWAAGVATIALSSGQTVSLTAPNLALAAPLLNPVMSVSLTAPNLALAAPVVTAASSGPAAISLTAPNLALAAPAVNSSIKVTDGGTGENNRKAGKKMWLIV
jgi:hypothetical protein